MAADGLSSVSNRAVGHHVRGRMAEGGALLVVERSDGAPPEWPDEVRP